MEHGYYAKPMQPMGLATPPLAANIPKPQELEVNFMNENVNIFKPAMPIQPCMPIYAAAGTRTADILVLFILLVIILRTFPYLRR